MKLAASIISWMFLPLIMPVVALLLVMFTPAELDYTSLHSLYYIPLNAKLYFIYTFLIFAFIAPCISIIILKASKIINTIEMDNKKERYAPLVLTAGYSIMLIVLLNQRHSDFYISGHLFAMAYSGLCVSVIFMTINNWTKISLHTGGAGMLVGFLIAYSLEQSLLLDWPIYFVVGLAGLIISARLILEKHTPKQAYLGFIAGSLITFVLDRLFISIAN